jgi:glucose dehydrogenase
MPVHTITFLIAAVLTGASYGTFSGQSTDWAHYGGTQWNERHAAFTQITTDNVAQLVPRHVLQLGEIPFYLTASPLVVDGALYVPASGGVLQAFDLRTGTKKWSYTHKAKFAKPEEALKAGGAGLLFEHQPRRSVC